MLHARLSTLKRHFVEDRRKAQLSHIYPTICGLFPALGDLLIIHKFQASKVDLLNATYPKAEVVDSILNEGELEKCKRAPLPHKLHCTLLGNKM
uniref:Uncharacterized protein n=1 Tax=Cyprinus carpio TaxID=7962 RepID=A0A8C2HTP8_CYPCA